MNYIKLILSAALVTVLLPLTGHADPSDNWNISTNPLGLILGVNANLQYKIADNMTIGPELSIVAFDINSVHASGVGFGVTGDYYYDQAFKTGWYTSAGLGYESISVDYTDSDSNKYSARVSNFSVKGLTGYKWFWGKSFNLTVGLGLVANFPSQTNITSSTTSDTKSVPISSVSLAGDASLGWTF